MVGWLAVCSELQDAQNFQACAEQHARDSVYWTGKQLRRSTSPTTSVRYLDGSTFHSWWDMDLQCPSKSTTSIRRQRLSKKCPVLITPLAIHLPVELSPSNGCPLDDIEGGTLQWQLQLQWSGERVDWSRHTPRSSKTPLRDFAVESAHFRSVPP